MIWHRLRQSMHIPTIRPASLNKEARKISTIQLDSLGEDLNS